MTRSAPSEFLSQPKSISFYVIFGLTLVFILCDVVIQSRMYVFAFGTESRALFFSAALIVVCVFVFINFIDGDHLPILVFLALTIYLLLQHFAFSLRTGIEFNLNVLAQCYGFLSFSIFYALSRRGMLRASLNLVFFVASVYLVVYCVVASLYYLGVIGDLTSADVYTVLADRERGNRLFLANGHATFVLMFSIVYLVERRTVGVLLTLCLAVAAITLSISRVLIATDVLVVLLFLAVRRPVMISSVAFGIYAALAIYLCWGIVFDFNPFEFSSTDSSTLYRRGEFTIMAEYIRQNPLFGIGLYDNVEGLAYLTGRSLLFPSDIGIVGTCFMFGVTGAVMFGILPAVICCFQRVRDHDSILPRAERTALLMVGAAVGIYSATAMTIFNGADSTCFGILLATWLRSLQTAQAPVDYADVRTRSQGLLGTASRPR